MHVDLTTLYLLAIGTLFASSLMTLWEYRVHPKRGKTLRILAWAYATLGVGCAAAAFRHKLPGITISAASNLVIVCGYLLILQGVASLSGRRYRVSPVVILVLLALAWLVAGTRGQEMMWNFWTAIPIAIASGMTAFELLRSKGLEGFQSRNIAVLVAGTHCVFYAFRSLLLPACATLFGMKFLLVAAQVTMYEGVLYSVVLPMTLLRLVREEAHGQLLRESRTDFLTGLGTRRWFFEEGARALRECGVTRPVSLLAFDLDHFKSINDRFGHETGDQVLESFARIARGVLGADAIFARIGGEEFAALLPGLDRFRAKELGERVVTRFAVDGARHIGASNVPVSVSVGLAQVRDEAPTLPGLMASADRALYGAKALGGNRLELAQDVERRVAA